MDYLQSLAVSAAGMAAERSRVEVSALNLAHAHTALDPAAPGAQPLRATMRATMRAVVRAEPRFGELVEGALPLPTVRVEPTGAPPRKVSEPGHPLADALGFVAYPGVDPAAEMMTLMSATRAYEANLVALNTARTLALKALDIGRNA